MNQSSSSRDDKKQVYLVMFYHHFGLFNDIKDFAIKILPKVTLKYYFT